MSTTTQTLRPTARLSAEPVHGLSFAGTIRAEIRKVLGQRSTPVFLVIGVAGFVGVMLLLTLVGTRISTDMTKQPGPTLALIQYALYLTFTVGSGIFLLLTSARLIGMEYSQGTLRILLARGTGRVSLLVAKLVALFAMGVALLIGYTVVSLVWVGLAVGHWTGSLSALTQGGSGAARDLGISLLLALLSMFSAVVVGSAMATIGRSVAFGVGAAMGLFPADNFGTGILEVIATVTHQKFWSDVTAYLFGPALNTLPQLAITNQKLPTGLPGPGVPVSLAHDLIVIGVWALGLLAIELVLTRRRDVLA